MGIYDQQQQLVDSVCEDIASFRTLIAPKDESKRSEFGFVPGMNNMQNAVNALDGHLRNLRAGIFQVLFVGGFSAGKSTLLNALMRKELLRMSINAETAVITKIVFDAEEEKVTVYKKQTDENGQPVTEYYSIAGFFEAYRVDQAKPDKFKEIAYVLIRQTQDGIGGSLVQLVDSPGTSNSEFDTLTAREFAAKANAVVYLINAVQPFTDDDKQYIKEHYAGQGLKNLFFVINRFDSVAPAEQGALKENVRNQLHDVFTVDGVFDRALFDSRVFYTNAFGSLNTRLGRETKTAYGDFLLDDNATGVPEFEKALGTFLTADDRNKNAFAAYIPKLSTQYTLAKAKTAEEIEQYKTGKAELERRRDELIANVDKVERILSGVQESCQLVAADLVRDVQRIYDEYVALIANEWDDHFSDPDVLENIKFNVIEYAKIAFTKDEKRKEELTKPLKEAVDAFLKSKQDVLELNIEQSVQAAAVKLADSIQNFQQQMEALDWPIDADKITKDLLVTLDLNALEGQNTKPNYFQVIMGLIGGDLDFVANGVVGTTNNTDAIIKFIAVNALEYIAINVVAWPIGLAMLIFKLRSMIKGIGSAGKDGAKKLLLGMKDQVISELGKAKANISVDFESKVAGAILKAGYTFSSSFRTELAGYQESYDQMIADLDSANFNLADEEERTKRQLEKMVEIISHISLLTTGKVLSESDVLARAEEKHSEN